MTEYGLNPVGPDARIFEPVTLGFPSWGNLAKTDFPGITIRNDVSLQSMVFIPTEPLIGDHVFIGPNNVLTNDRYSPLRIGRLKGPIIKNDAAIGANISLIPGVCIGGALVAAGAIVTCDVPDHMLAIGSPAKIKSLSREMTSGK